MYVIQMSFSDNYEHPNCFAIANDFYELKDILIRKFNWLSNDDGNENMEDVPCGWNSINDEIRDAESFDDLRKIVYSFMPDSGVSFNIEQISTGKWIIRAA